MATSGDVTNWPARKVLPSFVYRQFEFDAGQGYRGHRHSVDHPTVVVKGAVSVNVEGAVDIRHAPSHFIAPADKEHTITALEDGTIWLCIFLPPPGYEQDLREFWNEA